MIAKKGQFLAVLLSQSLGTLVVARQECCGPRAHHAVPFSFRGASRTVNTQGDVVAEVL
jgi:hypothetical protein